MSKFRIAHLAKTLSFLLPAFRAAAPPSKSSKTLLALFKNVIICAILAALSAFPTLLPPRKAGRFVAGTQIITR
jgi:hypothetical protein